MEMLITFILACAVVIWVYEKEKSNSTSVNGVEKCSVCGKYYQKPAKFCPHCGAETSKD